MNNFGKLKSKILQKFTEAYTNGNKGEIKNLLKIIKENKDFKQLYLFYEEIENKFIEDKETASSYVNEITPILISKTKNISKFCKELNKKIGDVVCEENELYNHLDILTENDTLKNTHNKIIAKRKIVDHLLTEKTIEVPESTIVENETLLFTVLSGNFNAYFDNVLNEEEKEELLNIISISNNELKTKFETLKEDVDKKMGEIIKEEKNDEVKDKLKKVIETLPTMEISKFNYYKLIQLQNGL